MDTEIVIKDLSKSYGSKRALKQISLTIGQGMFGLLGPNGAGKTTLMKILAALLKESAGEVKVCGVPISQTAKIRKMTGYLPQDFSMYGNMSAYEAMDYLGVLSGMKKSERRERIPLLLEQVNLKDHHKTRVKAMSGGMRRRLGIAQAILHDPGILIVDEPTAGLDPEERVRFRNLLCEIARERIVLLSTHIVGDIESTCEQIAILREGEVIYRGTVEKLCEKAEGKIYTATICARELEELKSRCSITGMIPAGNQVHVRFVSVDGAFPGAKKAEANVEDAYMYLMQEKRGAV